MLHAVLFLRRLECEAAPVRALGQGLFDRFCRDMDESMREMGVGDLAVPRKMRRIGEAFYGRQAVYRAALEAPDEQPLAAALQRTVFAGASEPRRPSGLRPTCARPPAGSPPRMDLSARSLPFPTPARCCCARDGQGSNHGQGRTHVQTRLEHAARRPRGAGDGAARRTRRRRADANCRRRARRAHRGDAPWRQLRRVAAWERRTARGRPRLGDCGSDLRGHARAGRERSRRADRPRLRASRLAVARRSWRRRARCVVRGWAGNAGRRHGRSRRDRDRIPDPRSRSLSAQTGRRVPGAGGGRGLRACIRRARPAEETAGRQAEGIVPTPLL